jgi:outer membrane receptor protein involved in Fe transport
LNLFSNFTYALNDPVHGDQIEQADRRLIVGARAFQRRRAKWRGHLMQNTIGVEVRNDDIGELALYHTQARVRLDTLTRAAVVESQGGIYAQNETEWKPWLRTLVGVRADVTRDRVDALDPVNSGTASASLGSPKGGVTVGPWRGTEFYVNAGTGFHSNDARGTTITRDPDGQPVDRVTPLVRAKGAEFGIRSVSVPHLQTTLTAWTLGLDSELVFSGDSGTTEPSRPSRRHGVEWTNYFRPLPWLVMDVDASWSRARFTVPDAVAQWVPEAVGTVLSGGVAVENLHRTDAAIRWRYFGPRALVEDDSVRSKATSLLNFEGGYRLNKSVRLNLEVFNLLNAPDSDIDYFYVSRLPGEPAGGIADIHTHPTIPRSARVSLHLGF